MDRRTHAMHWIVLGGWVLITPPTPLGVALPPESDWQQISAHETSDDCEDKRDAVREHARLVVTAGANAHALEVAAALGRLESRCIETADPAPADDRAAARADGAPIDRPATTANGAPVDKVPAGNGAPVDKTAAKAADGAPVDKTAAKSANGAPVEE